jgi:DNA repair exonuclease SbcCD ATPase subunit
MKKGRKFKEIREEMDKITKRSPFKNKKTDEPTEDGIIIDVSTNCKKNDVPVSNESKLNNLQDEIERLTKRLDEEERDCLQLMAERDAHEECINDLADALGDKSEWSSHSHRGENALELANELVDELIDVKKKNSDLTLEIDRLKAASSAKKLLAVIQKWRSRTPFRSYEVTLQLMKQLAESLENSLNPTYRPAGLNKTKSKNMKVVKPRE